MLIWIFYSLFLLIAFTYGYIKWSFSYWKRKKVPYLQPEFPYGNFEGIDNKKLGLSIQSIYNKLKSSNLKYAGIYFGPKALFMPIDPEYIGLILVKDFNCFDSRGLYCNEKDQPASANIAVVDGTRWWLIRNKFRQAFSSGKVKLMTEAMLKCSEDLVDSFKISYIKKRPVTKDLIEKYAVDVVGSCVFGLECNSFDETNDIYFKHVQKLTNKHKRVFEQLICKIFPRSAKFFGLVTFSNDTVEFFTRITEENIRYREEYKIVREDFLQVMLEMKKEAFEHGEEIGLQQIVAQAIFFFLAGYETVPLAIAFTLYEAGLNVEVQERIREDIETVLKKHDGLISYESINEMKYLDLAIQETLRKYPPVLILNRKCMEDYCIPGTDIIIEKNTDVVIPVIGIHMDSKIYPCPEKYDPMRFCEDSKLKRSPYNYLPFGGGLRNCIANKFGLLQIKVALVVLLKNFNFSVNRKMKFPMEFEGNLLLTPSQEILLDVEMI